MSRQARTKSSTDIYHIVVRGNKPPSMCTGERNEAIRKIKSIEGITLRQISRILGIRLNIVLKK